MDTPPIAIILSSDFRHLNELQQYVSGQNSIAIDGENTHQKPLLTEIGRLLNGALGREKSEEYKKDYLAEFQVVDGDFRFCKGILSLVFQIEMFNRLGLFLLSGEYIHFLVRPQTPKNGKKSNEDYVSWLKKYVPALTPVTQIREELEKGLKSKGDSDTREKLEFDQEQTDYYFDFNRRGDFFSDIINETLPGFLSSIEAHYHLTQVENMSFSAIKSDYLTRFQKKEYPLHRLFDLLMLNFKIAHEDHFISSEHKCLGQLVNCRNQLLKLMYSEEGNEHTEERDLIPIKYKFDSLFLKDNTGNYSDVFQIFTHSQKRQELINNFYEKLNEIIDEKFTPLVQALYEKTNFLIRKLLLRHGYRDIRDPMMMQLDDQRIPLIFFNRHILNFSYADYQLSYHLFEWEQRSKYNYSHTQTFTELEGYEIGVYRALLDLEEGNCKSSQLKSLDIYHYCTRYFRDFEPSPDYLYKLFDSFRKHIYEKVRDARNSKTNLNQIGTDKAINKIDPSSEHDWSAIRHMYNYLYNSCFSLRLSGNYSPPPDLSKAREWMSEVRLLQEETRVFSFFPYYKYARYLIKQIKNRISEESGSKEMNDLYIQLRETVTTCDNYFMLCKKNGFIPLHLPFGESFPYKENGNAETKKLPLEAYYGLVDLDGEKCWRIKNDRKIELYIASGYALPLPYDVISRRIDELKAEIESVALNQVTQLNEKFRNDSKALKDDLFKTFGWFTGIVSFIVGGIFKLSGNHQESVYDAVIFIACFGFCLMVFLFALFGLIKEKSPLWNRLFAFLEIRAEYNEDAGRETTFSRSFKNFIHTIRYIVASIYYDLYKLITSGLNPYPQDNTKMELFLKKQWDRVARMLKDMFEESNGAKPFGEMLFRWLVLGPFYLVVLSIGFVLFIFRVTWVMSRYLLLLVVKLFKYVSAGGALWRTCFFLLFFAGIIYLFKDKVNTENWVRDHYRDSLNKEIRVSLTHYKDSIYKEIKDSLLKYSRLTDNK